jgi:hypothetical protein
VRTGVLLLTAAAWPMLLAAGVIPLGLSSSPVDFTPITISTGTISVGACTSSCVVDGVYSVSPLDFTWTVTSTGTLAYSGGPTVYGLTGNTSSFSLTDAATDLINGTVAWNTATVGESTDLNGTLTLGTVSFASPTDPLALAAIAALGFLPISGEVGSVDLFVNCSGPCITTVDPTGQVFAAQASFSTATREPGTFALLGLGCVALGLLRHRLLTN